MGQDLIKNVIVMILKLIRKWRTPKHLRSSENYIEYLKAKGVKVGKGTLVFAPQMVNLDLSRPELLEIGDHVLLHRGTTIMTHDFASRAFVNRYNDFIPSHGKVKIGNNVWLGENVSILKGVTIGDNVIIGYGSIVTKNIPDNSVAVGAPAKIILTFGEYYEKRKQLYVEEAIEYALSIYASGRKPLIEDFYDDYPAFVDGSNYMDYDYPYYRVFEPAQFEDWKKNHKAPYHGFEAFMIAVNERMKK